MRARRLRRLELLAGVTGAGILASAGIAAGQSIPDTGLARLEMTAVLETLNADLLSHDSATLTLERWCAVHHLADTDRIRAELVTAVERPATAEVRRDLAVGTAEPVRYRRVRLSCGGRVLSEADNWYVPRLLTPSMRQALETTDTPFGRVVLPLGFSRHVMEATLLWRPLAAGWEMTGLPADRAGAIPVPAEILRHRAVLTTRAGVAFSVVVETYQRGMLAFVPTER